MKLHHSRQRALLLLCLVLLPLTKAWAAGHIDSIHVLEGVVVTERLIPKDVIPAQVLGGRDLQRLSAVSVADALRYFAGVQIKDYGGIGGLKTVNVRSMGSQHVGVFYDGLQLGNAQNGQIDLGRFSLDNMETVSIYNGQRSTILQPLSKHRRDKKVDRSNYAYKCDCDQRKLHAVKQHHKDKYEAK